ncbi:unnamed protein product [Orchesella dallaii]|uniref:MACPF domain-containing protein n=1 Tax=Orchesella dallaii TaxID=48710 RepID=A0ABP1RZ35_9HEXA
MATSARKKETQCFLLIFITLFVTISECWENPYRERQCGILHSENDFQGEQFPLKDGDEAADLFEDHRASLGWNITSSILVESGCSMEICNETYFDGVCLPLEQGSYSSSAQLPPNFSGGVGSVRCNCQRECKCEDIFMKKSSCARAYLKGGCKTCNTLYTDLNDFEGSFREEMRGKVEAFTLRKGCILTVFPEEDHGGEGEVITDAIFEDYTGTFSSYECECNDDEYVPRVRPPRPPTFPALVDIPESVDDVIKMLRNETYSGHPGLIAALKSMKNRRSGKNAYILLLGSTGAGKSSAINLLFDNPNVTKVGHGISTTTDIHEFRIPIPIDELGIANSELRVIDTPGLGDTRGLEQDAKFLATLESYLDSHEELKHRIPNVVLVFHKYNDNRFKGDGAGFVKMVRGLQHFRHKLTDENFSNVIFVFSHFCSETPANTRRPTNRLNQFKRVIEDFSLFPKPILLAVAENKAKEEWQLPVLNGFYKLPNNEYYPRNLFEKLELVTKNGQDMVGMGVFRTAFRDSENFNVTRSDFTLVGRDSSSVVQFLRILSNAHYGVNNTEISQMLTAAWETGVSSSLKKQFPDSLPYLQKSLNMQNINVKEDIPKTTTEILQLLTAIKHDEATRKLLEVGLGIKPPVFTQNTVAGHGYDVFKDTYLPSSPYQLGENPILADIGYLIPEVLTCKMDKNTAQQFITFNNQEEYIQHRLRSLVIAGDMPPESYKGQTKPGHNIRTDSFRNDSCTLSATREFRLFEFILNDRQKLTKEFQRDVKALPVFNSSSHETVDQWKAFFNEYGTHIVRSVYGGGEIQIKLESNQPFNDDMRDALFDVIKFAEDMTFLLADGNGTGSGTKTVLKEGTSHSLTFIGGDSKYHTTDLTKLKIDDAVNLMTTWKQSLKFTPAILTTEMRLEPMSQVVKKLGQNYSTEIEKATSLLFNASLKFDPNAHKRNKGDPPPRDQTDYMTQVLKESNQQMQALLLEIRKMEALNEERRHNLSVKRLEWEATQKEQDRIYNWNVTQAQIAQDDKQVQLLKDLEDKRNAAAKVQSDNQVLLTQTMTNASDAASKRNAELMKELIKLQQPTSCLKKGTRILMTDLSQKPVEQLKIGDVILDMNMMPTSVLGVAYEFIFDQKFYGFDEDSFFFTNTHLFAGPSSSPTAEDFKLYAKSTHNLFYNNPLMKYLNVSDMEGVERLHLFYHDEENESLSAKDVTVYEDPQEYSQDIPIYFIQVDSPTGTYFANGYVCRHEIPPVEYWPNTMGLLFRLMDTETFGELAELPYTLENAKFLQNVTIKVAENVKQFLEKEEWKQERSGEQYEIMTLGDIDMEENIGKIFNNPSIAAVGVGLYARVGEVVAPYLDDAEGSGTKVVPGELGKLQSDVYQIVNLELSKYI